MDFTTFSTGKNDEGRRLDKVLRRFLPDLPLSAIYKDLRKGLIKVNQIKAKPEQKIQENDKINIALFLLEEAKNENSSNNSQELPEVIFNNEHIIILNKPYNQLVQKTKKDDFSLDELVKNYYKNNNSNDNSLSFTPGPLHRLDRNTTGLICFSWSLQGAQWFSKHIQEHSIQKKYLGIVQGNLKEKQEWKDNIQKDFNSQNAFQTVKVFSSDEYNSYTIATPLKHGIYNDFPITVVEFDIKTGKTHQIRSQSSFHGFPLLGDSAYRGKKQNLTREYFLHAYELYFPKDNPLSLPHKITCPLQKDMEDFILKTCES